VELVGVSRRLRRDGRFVAGMTVITLMGCLALAAPFLPLPAPDQVDGRLRLRQPGVLVGHLLGTDEFGRDILSRLVWGARLSLAAGLLAATGSLLLGFPLGVLAGFLGGAVDLVIMRLTEILMAFPILLLAIAVVAGLGPGLVNTMVAVAVAGFPAYARLTRSTVQTVVAREFVGAARAIGGRNRRVLVRHVVPNILGAVSIMFSLDIGAKTLATAGLSFLGFGVTPPTAEWGSMLASGREFLTSAPHVATLPGLAIALVVLAANLVGDAVREALDPRARMVG
jgi:peptide/nickel transport system permease protein